jgi:hypothetical protein
MRALLVGRALPLWFWRRKDEFNMDYEGREREMLDRRAVF